MGIQFGNPGAHMSNKSNSSRRTCLQICTLVERHTHEDLDEAVEITNVRQLGFPPVSAAGPVSVQLGGLCPVTDGGYPFDWQSFALRMRQNGSGRPGHQR
jgi:hypothetical protein